MWEYIYFTLFFIHIDKKLLDEVPYKYGCSNFLCLHPASCSCSFRYVHYSIYKYMLFCTSFLLIWLCSFYLLCLVICFGCFMFFSSSFLISVLWRTGKTAKSHVVEIPEILMGFLVVCPEPCRHSRGSLKVKFLSCQSFCFNWLFIILMSLYWLTRA